MYKVKKGSTYQNLLEYGTNNAHKHNRQTCAKLVSEFQ